MPNFRLELPDRQKERKEYRMTFTKKDYNSNIKVSDWNYNLESKPIDDDPYCKGKENFFKSHYRQLGTQDAEEPFVTTTMKMLRQIHTKDNYSFPRMKNSVINYISYKDWLPCEEMSPICPPRCVNNYSTTMQYSYSPPYPYVMQRLSCPVIPFLQNRRLRNEDPDLSSYKFHDEGFPKVTTALIRHKSFRSKSYNPCTDEYSDGSKFPANRCSLYKLEYRE